jgi:hypothetical protein
MATKSAGIKDISLFVARQILLVIFIPRVIVVIPIIVVILEKLHTRYLVFNFATLRSSWWQCVFAQWMRYNMCIKYLRFPLPLNRISFINRVLR